MQLEIVDRLERLSALEREWSSFAEAIPDLAPFQLPEWLLTWWRHFGSGELHVLLFREHGAIAGIVPCFLHEWNGRRQLTLVGSGISDYLEPAVGREHGAAVLDLLRAHLADGEQWDVCHWQDLTADSPLAGIATLEEDTPCSEIRLTGRFEQYWAQRSKDLRRNLRRYGNRAQETGVLEFDVTAQADDGLLEELMRLHGDRWQKQGQPGMVVANNSAEFLCEVAREFEKRQVLRLFSLRYSGEVVAISIGFLYRNTLYSYLSAFDTRYEILGFGRKLLYESLRHAYGQRYTTWNFCRGDEPYKFSFGAERIPKRRLILTRAALHID